MHGFIYVRQFMKKTIYILIAIANFFTSLANAQGSHSSKSIFERMDEHGVLNKLEVAANIGTTGFGLELASPVTEWTKIRVGVDFMPRFNIPLTFDLNSYVDGQLSDKFDRIQEMMYDLSGLTIDKDIKMDSKPTMTTMRILVDVYPFRNNRHWHFTAGFFYGGNSFGTCLNRMNEMPSLLTLNMYNRMYEQYRGIPTQTPEDFQSYIIDHPINLPILGDQYIDPDFDDPENTEFWLFYDKIKKFKSFGELGIHVGEHEDGTPYMMMPDEDGTVSAKAKVWRFRPYLGFGYGGFVDREKRWHVSFDAGAQYWGGAPKVTTHDGTILNDLAELRGKVDTYMNFMKTLVVYPTLDFRIAYCF